MFSFEISGRLADGQDEDTSFHNYALKHRKSRCILPEKLHESSAWLLTVFSPFS